jgi:hypothetical protein
LARSLRAVIASASLCFAAASLDRARSAWPWASKPKKVETAVPANSAAATPAIAPASAGSRRTHFAARSSAPTGRARIGSPARKRRRSLASSSALA